MRKQTIIYTTPVNSSFMRQDIEALGKEFEVTVYTFDATNKLKAPFLLIHQYFYLLFNRCDIYVSLFASYHSWLPGVFAKKRGKQHLIVLGGTDCVSFPSINYGNFNKKTQGKYTRKSLLLATHLAPVDDRLVECDYTYTQEDFSRQGYKHFVPEVTAPHTVVNFGYDPDRFLRISEKNPKSFITVGYLNASNFYRKGVDLILSMADHFSDCTFTVIGGTREDVPGGVKIPENVSFIASVSYEELVQHYSSHQFYLQLSIMEGFPSAICEAMLCECVPIGSDVGAIPTIIGDTGYILHKKDKAELERLIERAMETANDEQGKLARTRIMEKYPKNEREKLSRLVQRLLN